MAGVAGQGRRFSAAEALEAATMVFWKHGYEGASLKMLTTAMGINPPSMYKAFGSKDELFFSAIEHYNATYGRFFTEALEEEATAAGLLPRILHAAAEHYTQPEFPGGCLTISAAVTVTPENKRIAERLSALRNCRVEAIKTALDQTPDWKDSLTPAKTAAAFMGATMQGMSQQARDGATAQSLHATADLALTALGIPSGSR